VSADITRAIDELYGLPPKAFSSARNEKAAALKAAGHAAEAQAVRRLAKPSPFLWATNQLARLHAERVAHFVDLVRRVRQSQLRDPRTAAEGMQTIRAELHTLTGRAIEVLTRAGYRVPASGAARISNTVLGAAVDDGLVDDLRHGRLAAELAAPGFEVLAGAVPGRKLELLRGGKSAERQPQLGPESKRAREQAERARRAQEAVARRREAEQRAAEAARAADEVRELERQLAEARRKLRSARREAEAAAERARRRTD
jgi:hypothetical protein